MKTTALVHQELKVNWAQTALAVVNDVLGPHFAFNVDENTGCCLKMINWLAMTINNYCKYCRLLTFRLLELQGDDGTQITGNVFVGEIVGWETSEWCVCDIANMLTIGRVLTITRDPNHFQLWEKKPNNSVQLHHLSHAIGTRKKTRMN